MRTAASSIGDIIDKLRDDVKDEADDSVSPSGSLTIEAKPSFPKCLSDLHPSSLDGLNAISVVVYSILMFRDEYYGASAKKQKSIQERVAKLDGSISAPGSQSFHVNVKNHGDNVSINVYDTYVEFLNIKWYMKIHVTFPETSLGKMHVFPLVDLESGVNHASFYWNNIAGDILCRSDLPESVLAPILDYAASIKYHLDMSGKTITVSEHLKKPDIGF